MLCIVVVDCFVVFVIVGFGGDVFAVVVGVMLLSVGWSKNFLVVRVVVNFGDFDRARAGLGTVRMLLRGKFYSPCPSIVASCQHVPAPPDRQSFQLERP